MLCSMSHIKAFMQKTHLLDEYSDISHRGPDPADLCAELKDQARPRSPDDLLMG